MSLPSNSIFKKPFVLSMGPQRAGTSWLDRYLRARGDVCLPSEVKEVFFFDRHYPRGVDFYKRHFSVQDDHACVMEVSTTAFDTAEAPRYVHEVFGDDVTLLCPLRCPVVRSYSLYLHYKRYGMVNGSLQDACRENPNILNSSRYADHLKNWFEYYPKERISFVFLEDLNRDYEAYAAQVCRALNLPDMPVPVLARGRYNAAARAPFPALAHWGQRAADTLRRRGLYALVNIARVTGLKALVFGKGNGEFIEEGRAEDVAWLQEQLAGEVEKLEALIGPVEAWRHAKP